MTTAVMKSAAGNLPVELSSFVGRDHELGEVRRLLGSAHVITVTGPGGTPGACVPTHYRMAFEGRPADGSVLQPGRQDSWELKYGFGVLGGVQYAANIWYRIAGNGGTVEYTIQVFNFSNESSCRVTPANAGRCTAEGTKLTFQ